MNWRNEWKTLALLIGVFLAVFYLPVGLPRFDNAIMEGLKLVKWYTQEHLLLCVVPAVFVSQASVMRFLRPASPKGMMA